MWVCTSDGVIIGCGVYDIVIGASRIEYVGGRVTMFVGGWCNCGVVVVAPPGSQEM